jgi:hypothetical protein
MIPVPSGVRVWLATGHTDMRKGFASLSLHVQEILRRDPLSGQLFCFRGRRGDLLKVIWHDGRLLEQMELQLEDLETAATEDELVAETAAVRTQTVQSFQRKRPSRKPFPDHLPRERIVIAVPESCPCCGSAKHGSDEGRFQTHGRSDQGSVRCLWTLAWSAYFRLCCGGRGLGGYPRDGFLSLFHGPGYVGHQLFQIVLGSLKLRRLCVHFPSPHSPPSLRERARPQY